MLIVCWSVKGGSGTTVVATSLALLHATRGIHTTLVDLSGDVPACLGMADPLGPGVGHWFDGYPAGTTAVLDHLTVPSTADLRVLPVGLAGYRASSSHWESLAAWCAHQPGTVVVDAGVGEPPDALCDVADESLLVVRGCYLALRRTARLLRRPDGVILISEPGRALRRPDVEAVSGTPVVAQLEWDPVVARSIDAGLLAGRLPRSIREGLGELSWIP